jgi:hypothetical protein
MNDVNRCKTPNISIFRPFKQNNELILVNANDRVVSNFDKPFMPMSATNKIEAGKSVLLSTWRRSLSIVDETS